MMHMTLYWGIQVTLLLDSWKTDSLLSYLLTLLACFLFAAFYQYMEDRRIRLKASTSSSSSPPPPSPVNAPLLLPKPATGPTRLAGAILFGVNSAMGYLLMLAVMSFNGGVFLAIVLGLSLGYLLFRSGGNQEPEILLVDNNTCACA
ncbi:unnamed protein product [Linum tenue]|uniref:Copper transport protein n=1 Tax=Linum tenue TaxID=586396 RepID=A0AAV0MQM0_9ROSI|nr:unnamed protein product [Linum tenue]